ncbi:MAG: hypothetical protein KAH32_05175 [Chlamydiia bacterium]|nr:hypothetical protein [Chlamydiia bacterium]
MGIYKDRKYINKYGSVYDTYGAKSLGTLFTSKKINGVIKKKSGVKGRLRNIYKTKDSTTLAKNIYFNYLILMIEDVIRGDAAELTKHKFPIMYMGMLPEMISTPLISKMVYTLAKIDIKKFKYRFPRVFIHFGPDSKYYDRVVHVPKDYYEEMIENLSKMTSLPEYKFNIEPKK